MAKSKKEAGFEKLTQEQINRIIDVFNHNLSSSDRFVMDSRGLKLFLQNTSTEKYKDVHTGKDMEITSRKSDMANIESVIVDEILHDVKTIINSHTYANILVYSYTVLDYSKNDPNWIVRYNKSVKLK
jgi:hypothetical protein